MTVAIEMGNTKAGALAAVDLEELLATRLLVQGNSGSGKSHLAAIWRELARSGAELEDLWDPRSGPRQRHRLSDQLFGAPHGSRAADRT